MQGRAIVRVYLSAADPAIVMMNLLTAEVKGGGEHPLNYLEITTRYRDGSMLSTRNAEISEVLAHLPEQMIQERKGIRDPEQLKRFHDSKADELRIREPIYSQADEFEPAFHEFHERWCAYQISQGLLCPRSGDGERLRPTVKAGLRGILNYLNPLADNFTMPRFLLGVVFGLLLPAAGIFWLRGPGTKWVSALADATGFNPELWVVACLVVLFTVSGSVVGLLFVGKSFIWSFLLSYVLLRLVGPTGVMSTLLLSAWSGTVAGWAAIRREKYQKLA
jgi:hypothetical protein